MTQDPSRRPDRLRLLLGGAASGALALAALAAVEIAARHGANPPMSSPWRDLSLLAMGGAAAGAVLGLLRARLRFLFPFGIALGGAVALRFWLASVTGSHVLTGPGFSNGLGLVTEALRGLALLLAGAAAGQLAGLALRRIPVPAPPAAVNVVILVLLAAPALRPRAAAGGETGRPNVLLLTIDTLRADRPGFAGNPRPVTPYLDRLARRGTIHSRVVTPIPRTLPSFTSVMTGEPPQAHGVRDNFHYSLGKSAPTLAEELRARGWTCAAVSSNPVLSHDSGVFRGFVSASDRGDDWSRLSIVRGLGRITTLLEMRAGDREQVITDLALRWLSRRPAGRPWFLWVHWLAPHMPYQPSFPFDRIYDPGYEGEYRYSIDYDKVEKGVMTYRCPLDDREREHVVALYDGEVATSDRAVGRLLRAMEDSGALENTVVLFTADHGESLLEHGYFFNHGDFVYGPAADVPYVAAGPGAVPGAIDPTPGSLLDVKPRLVALATGGSPPEHAPDRPLFGESGLCRFPDLNDRIGGQLPTDVARNPHAPHHWRTRWEALANRAKQRFVQVGNWKLVRSPQEEGARDELYELRRDPGETDDVADAHPGTVAALASDLDAWVASADSAASTAGERSLDEGALEQMEALGYLGN